MNAGKTGPGLELWGGAECTLNRVRDEYFEQLTRTGHISRISDFVRFAELGIKAIRQPILWESLSSNTNDAARWEWPDHALRKLKQLNIRPIIGLMHHGSGPKHTNLLDPELPVGLSRYAELVARRYPEVQDYTPVNEPLTTARFSALYGYWYPHHRNELSFARALLNQCRAIVLAMEAIRKINPSARLIQTDDLGRTYSSPTLEYQAEYENERRWSTYDLLCGRLQRDCTMWGYLRWAGIEESELSWFIDHPCPPAIIGINHYLSGERYLDEHLERYDKCFHGGNGRHAYADVLATRVLQHGTEGPRELIRAAWERYHLPIAVTECHNGCTREEQLRWFLEVWRSALQAKREGAKVIAVTAWSLLGAFDWNQLVTCKADHYEPGVFDIRSDPPRPTAMAALVRDLAVGVEPKHPLLDVPGWWRRSQRFVYGFSADEKGDLCPAPTVPLPAGQAHIRPVLITGARGRLAGAFGRICELRGIPYRMLARDVLDIADQFSVRKALLSHRPWAVINTAGYARVDNAEAEEERCFRENAHGPYVLASECARLDIQLLTFSSDLVFDGASSRPYVESDPLCPVNQYGKSKAEAEKHVLKLMPEALIIRSAALFGPWDERSFVGRALRALSSGDCFRAAYDTTISPTYIPDLVHASLDLLIDKECGVFHLANEGQVTWAELAERVAGLVTVSTHTLQRCRQQELAIAARWPAFSAIASERARIMPSLENALERFVAGCEFNWNTGRRVELAA